MRQLDLLSKKSVNETTRTLENNVGVNSKEHEAKESELTNSKEQNTAKKKDELKKNVCHQLNKSM